MPILKFRCSSCAKEWAKIILNPEQTPHQCPVCGSVDLEEVGPAFSYEGKSLERLMPENCNCCGEECCSGHTESSS